MQIIAYILGLFDLPQIRGGLELVIIVGVLSFYIFKYKPDQDKLIDHIKQEPEMWERFRLLLDGLLGKVNSLETALVREHITKANIHKTEWASVIDRIHETAHISFDGAFEQCIICEDTKECNYFDKFCDIVQDRRKESFHVWERAAVPTSILTIVEQVDKALFSKVIQDYIYDIVSLCSHHEYKNLPKELRLNLLRSKISMIIERVKSDWTQEILKRVNIE